MWCKGSRSCESCGTLPMRNCCGTTGARLAGAMRNCWGHLSSGSPRSCSSNAPHRQGRCSVMYTACCVDPSSSTCMTAPRTCWLLRQPKADTQGEKVLPLTHRAKQCCPYHHRCSCSINLVKVPIIMHLLQLAVFAQTLILAQHNVGHQVARHQICWQTSHTGMHAFTGTWPN